MQLATLGFNSALIILATFPVAEAVFLLEKQ